MILQSYWKYYKDKLSKNENDILVLKNNLEKLQEEVNSAIEGDTITLASDFTFGDIELIMPDVNIIIDVKTVYLSDI